MFDDVGRTRCHSIVLSALYLAGLPRVAEPRRQAWGRILSLLQQSVASLGDASAVLRRAGWDLEAALCSDAQLLGTCERLVDSSFVLTVGNRLYPARWLERLGSQAPPALWWNGVAWAESRSLTIVGSRSIPERTRAMARAFGSKAATEGWLVVSGGAIGCDREATRGALERGGLEPSAAVTVLPHGIRQSRRLSSALLSVCAPDAPFSSSSAMERNALLYAWSDWSLVVDVRLREGGTWVGATDAIRRRLTRIAVSSAGHEGGWRALTGLGATPVRNWDELARLLAEEANQAESPLLYGTRRPEHWNNSVRELRSGWNLPAKRISASVLYGA